MEFGLLCFLGRNANAFAVLPDIAAFAGHTMSAVIHLAIQSADAVEGPVIVVLFQFLESLLVLLDFSVQMAFGDATFV